MTELIPAACKISGSIRSDWYKAQVAGTPSSATVS
jgi:hypothetical protein